MNNANLSEIRQVSSFNSAISEVILVLTDNDLLNIVSRESKEILFSNIMVNSERINKLCKCS